MEILPKKIRKKLIIFKKYSMKFISVIPARKNSQGIKNKNIMNIYNKPLIEYTFKEVKKSNLKLNFAVTDSEKIKKQQQNTQ